MKKKYYYDCPIKALYMNKEFGVNFSEAHGANHADKFFEINEIQLCDFATKAIEDFRGIEQIYVAPESEHIFEPKEGDFVSNYLHGNKSRHCHGFLSAQSSLTTSATIITPERKNETSYFVESKSQITIIMRDNKHFFTPKEEN